MLGKAGRATETFINDQVARVNDPARTAEIDHDVVAGPKGWQAYGAFDSGERRRALDDLGFAKQLVFSTFSATQYLSSGDMDVLYGGVRAHNRAMAEFCQSDPRLIAVGQVSLVDPERALEEVREGIALGCRAFWIPASPAGERSLGHGDLDPIWRLLSERGVPFVFHVGPATKVFPKEYFNNGKPLPKDRLGGGENLRVKDFMVLSFAPQMALASMVFDGVFERFPTLRGGVIELGAGWVAEFMRQLDLGFRSFRKSDAQLEALSLKPSEYIRRQVKFTPYHGEDVGRMIRETGAELFLFSSDYPHPEGTRDPIGHFERTLNGIPADLKERFYWQNMAEMLQVA
jgi:predicted TIM-barrel fold metal-dependent hydrolase